MDDPSRAPNWGEGAWRARLASAGQAKARRPSSATPRRFEPAGVAHRCGSSLPGPTCSTVSGFRREETGGSTAPPPVALRLPPARRDRRRKPFAEAARAGNCSPPARRSANARFDTYSQLTQQGGAHRPAGPRRTAPTPRDRARNYSSAPAPVEWHPSQGVRQGWASLPAEDLYNALPREGQPTPSGLDAMAAESPGFPTGGSRSLLHVCGTRVCHGLDAPSQDAIREADTSSRRRPSCPRCPPPPKALAACPSDLSLRATPRIGDQRLHYVEGRRGAAGRAAARLFPSSGTAGGSRFSPLRGGGIPRRGPLDTRRLQTCHRKPERRSRPTNIEACWPPTSAISFHERGPPRVRRCWSVHDWGRIHRLGHRDEPTPRSWTGWPSSTRPTRGKLFAGTAPTRASSRKVLVLLSSSTFRTCPKTVVHANDWHFLPALPARRPAPAPFTPEENRPLHPRPGPSRARHRA